MSEDVRWKQRLASLQRAVSLLRQPFTRELSSLSALEQEGTAQRFEFAFELAWKTMKDYLENEGRTIVPVTPKSVIKTAFSAHILSDGQVWIDMIQPAICSRIPTSPRHWKMPWPPSATGIWLPFPNCSTG